ncbi:MAG TPA: hypothetical protein ENK57_01685 [Polyangiaceae bacterium]|nr:hypothetical protein [Polyangiaceae bacterium]
MVRFFASLSVVALAFAACAFPSIDFRPADEDDGNTSSTSSSGGAGGTGGVGGAPSVGGTGGTIATCVVGDPNSCPLGSKCSYDELSGTIDCVVAGNRPAWTRCASDGDCETGTFCDGVTAVCHPVCQSAAQCGTTASQCILATDTAGMTIPGFRVCTSNCSPFDASPCSDAAGNTTCYYNPGGSYWDCTKTVGLTQDSNCNGEQQCGRGLVCEAGSNTCLPWCVPVGDVFCSGISSVCAGVNPMISWEAQEIGICIDV